MEFTELRLQGIKMNQPAKERISGTGEKFDRLGGLQHPDDSGKNAEDTRLRAIRYRAGKRWLWKKTAVARPAKMGRKNGALTLETRNRSVNEGLFQKHTDIVTQIARREIVRSIQDQIVGFHDIHRRGGIETDIVNLDADIRIGLEETLSRTVGFFSSDIGAAMKNLALEVCLIHNIEIDDSEGSHAGGSEIKTRWRAKPTRSNAKNTRGFQAFLALQTESRQGKMAGITRDLPGTEFGYGYTRRINETHSEKSQMNA
jgi:hypothetical protein